MNLETSPKISLLVSEQKNNVRKHLKGVRYENYGRKSKKSYKRRKNESCRFYYNR